VYEALDGVRSAQVGPFSEVAAESFDRMISCARWKLLTPDYAGVPPVMSELQWEVVDLVAGNTIANVPRGCGQLPTLTSAVGGRFCMFIQP
jgi:hypothetical protein